MTVDWHVMIISTDYLPTCILFITYLGKGITILGVVAPAGQQLPPTITSSSNNPPSLATPLTPSTPSTHPHSSPDAPLPLFTSVNSGHYSPNVHVVLSPSTSPTMHALSSTLTNAPPPTSLPTTLHRSTPSTPTPLPRPDPSTPTPLPRPDPATPTPLSHPSQSTPTPLLHPSPPSTPTPLPCPNPCTPTSLPASFFPLETPPVPGIRSLPVPTTSIYSSLTSSLSVPSHPLTSYQCSELDDIYTSCKYLYMYRGNVYHTTTSSCCNLASSTALNL